MTHITKNNNAIDEELITSYPGLYDIISPP